MSKDLDEVLEKLKKRYGASAVMPASKARALQIPRFESGIFAIDYATGGGWPIGRIMVVWGDKSSGKSLLVMKSVASAQRYCRRCLLMTEPTGKMLNRCPHCGSVQPKDVERCQSKVCLDVDDKKGVAMLKDAAHERKCMECKKNEEGGHLGYDPFRTLWQDAESVYSLSWSARLGVNNDLVYLNQPENAEDGIDIARAMLRGGCELYVCDTIAHLTPKKEIEGSMDDQTVGVAAKLMSRALRDFVSSGNEHGLNDLNRPTIFLLNQERANIGVTFGPKEIKPVGKAQDFADSIEVKMWPGKVEKDAKGMPMCTLSNFVCDKNKTAPPKLQGSYRVWLRDLKDDDGVDRKVGDTEEVTVVMDYALKFEAIQYDGKKYTFDGVEATSKDEIRAAIVKDREKFRKLRRLLMTMPLGTISHDLVALEKAQKNPRKW